MSFSVLRQKNLEKTTGVRVDNPDKIQKKNAGTRKSCYLKEDVNLS